MSKHRPTARSITAAAVASLAAPALVAATAGTAHAANAAPKIVAAVMVDNDHDDKADEVRLTYSEPVSHPLDTSVFPFKVSGYTITRIPATSLTKTLRITLKEKTAADIAAKPAITYTRTTTQPVRDNLKLQALTQTFNGTLALDRDGDGYGEEDCAKSDAAINPGATDVPELTFTDADCDGIDGDADTAIFVDHVNGNDTYYGYRNTPVKSLTQAFNQVSSVRRQILVTNIIAPSADVINVPDGVGIYAGYDPAWKRSMTYANTNGKLWRTTGTSTIELVNMSVGGDDPALRVTGGVLNLNRVKVTNAVSETNSIALLVTGGAKVTVRDSSILSGQAGSRPNGNGAGVSSVVAEAGENGEAGSCDTFNGGDSGLGGGAMDNSAVAGGWGGLGGRDAGGSNANGGAGDPGSGGATGGTAGAGGNPGKAGGNGARGADGANGVNGTTVAGTFSSTGWKPKQATDGTDGKPGQGGGGGGGGGGQTGLTVISGVGNGGAGGGEGGSGGGAGGGGLGGYASVAAYVVLGTLVVHDSTITSGKGGNGGVGGMGVAGKPGGAGGTGGSACLSEVGRGGNGGAGGTGGAGGKGGNGQAGPSIGVFTGAYAVLENHGATIVAGEAGSGPLAIRAAVY